MLPLAEDFARDDDAEPMLGRFMVLAPATRTGPGGGGGAIFRDAAARAAFASATLLRAEASRVFNVAIGGIEMRLVRLARTSDRALTPDTSRFFE